jgi:nitroreductase
LEILWRSGLIDSSTLVWGKSVLDEYFRLCQHTQDISRAFDSYQKLDLNETGTIRPSYAEKDRPKLSVDYNAFHQLAVRRRSVRHFLDRAVDFDLVKKAMETALLSPSACNRQAFRFLYVNDRELVDRLRRIPGGAEFPIPSLMIVVGQYSGYFDERDFKVPIIDASLAAMSFMYSLETLGLSSVCINWPALPDRNEVLQKTIQLNKDEFVILLLAIGYPDPEAKIAYAGKRNLAEMLSLIEATERNDSRDPRSRF